MPWEVAKYRTLQTQNRARQNAGKNFHQPFVRLRKILKTLRGEKFCSIVSWKKAFAASGEAATIIPRSKGIEMCERRDKFAQKEKIGTGKGEKFARE